MMGDMQKQAEQSKKEVRQRGSQTVAVKSEEKKVLRNQFTHMSKEDLQIIGQGQNQLSKNKLTQTPGKFNPLSDQELPQK